MIKHDYHRHRHYIDGAWTPSTGGDRIATSTPYDLAGAVWAEDTDRPIAFTRGSARACSTSTAGRSTRPRPSAASSVRASAGSSAGLEEYLPTTSLQLPVR